jgi:uncharacterized membrane protein
MDYITIIYALGIIGVINTIYLSYHTITKKPVLCLFFPEEWCRKVQYSSWSRTFGIPNSFAGFVIYSVLLILTYMHATDEIAIAPIQWLIYVGFAFSMYFLLVQAVILKAFCTWCVLSAVEFTLLLLTVIYLV